MSTYTGGPTRVYVSDNAADYSLVGTGQLQQSFPIGATRTITVGGCMPYAPNPLEEVDYKALHDATVVHAKRLAAKLRAAKARIKALEAELAETKAALPTVRRAISLDGVRP